MVDFRVCVRHVECVGNTPNVDQPIVNLEVLSYNRSISAPSTQTMSVKGRSLTEITYSAYSHFCREIVMSDTLTPEAVKHRSPLSPL